MTATHVLTAPDSARSDGSRSSRPAPPPVASSATGLHRAAGVAALVSAATYVIGFVAMGAYLGPEGFDDGGPVEKLRFLVDHHAVLAAWYTVLYLVAGAALVVLSLGLHDRLRRAEPALSRVAAAFGLVWSGLLLASGMIAVVGQQAAVDLHATDPDRAATVYAAVSAVQDGLGGGIELVGALWVLGLSWIGLRTGLLRRGLCILGAVVGAAGVLTVVPALAGFAAVFGLGFIAWFAWAGLVLLRRTA